MTRQYKRTIPVRVSTFDLGGMIRVLAVVSLVASVSAFAPTGGILPKSAAREFLN